MKITSLSPSMVNTARICMRRFYYAEVVREPYLPNHFLAFGAAFHETARENYWQKREKEKDLPIDLLTDFFCEDLEYRDVDWSESSLDKTKDEGVISVRAYMEKVAPRIQPLHVEHAWSMNVKNRDWKITGKTDLIDDHNQVVDLKTTSRKVSSPKDGHTFQIGVYVAAWRAQTGQGGLVQGRLDFVVRGKDDVISIPVEFNGNLASSVVAEFDDVAKWIQREQWIPSRHYNNLCSRRYCNFFRQCEADCGGTIKD